MIGLRFSVILRGRKIPKLKAKKVSLLLLLLVLVVVVFPVYG